MVNLFGQVPPPQQDPQSDGTGDSVEEAVAQMMAAQQQNEPSPRPPTPQEVEQIKQGVAQMKQAQGMPGGAAFMGMGGMNPSVAPQQTQQGSTPPPGGNQIPSTTQGLPPQLQGAFQPPSGGGTGFYPPSPAAQGRANELTTRMAQNAQSDLSGLGGPLQKIAEADLPKTSAKEGDQEKQVDADIAAMLNAKPDLKEEDGKAQPEPSEADEQGQLKQEPNAPTVGNVGTTEPEHLKYIAEVAAPQAAKIAKAAVKDGIDTPEKAYAWARTKFAGDPEIDQAIADAKATYEQIKAVNNEAPSTGQLIGAVLLGLLGVHPQVIQNVLHGNRSPQREQMAGEALLKLQLQKAAGLRHQAELDAKQGPESLAQARLDQQYELARQHEQGMQSRADSANRLNEIKTMIDNYRSLEEKKNADATRSIGKQKAQLINDANDARKARAFYENLLQQEVQKFNLPKPPGKGAPVSQEPGGPTSMGSPAGGVSPSAARLLGMSA